MSQTVLVALLGILLYISSLLSGQAPATGPGWNSNKSVGTAFTAVGYVKESPATLRQGPGTDKPRVTTLAPKSQVEILRQENGWYKVKTESGTTGWVASMLVQAGAGVEAGQHEVIGYYVEADNRSSLTSLQKYHNQLTTVVPWSFSLSTNGQVVNAAPPDMLGEVLRFVGRNTDLKTLALISNYDQVNHEFSQTLARSVLRNPSARQNAVNNIAKVVQDWGVAGVNIDFEHVDPNDRLYYTAFIKELSQRLRQKGFLTTVSIPAKTYDDRWSAWSGAFDYAAIGQYADLVMLMAYDEHWRGGNPGPIASAGWVEQVVRYAVTQIPKEKIILGVPAYGYAWRAPKNGSTVNYASAVRLAKRGSGVLWDPSSKTPYAYSGGQEIWFENAASLSYKLDIVTRYGIKGIAMWRLGQEDPNVWRVIDSKLGT